MCLWWKWQPLNFLFYTMTCCKECPKRTHADVPKVLRKVQTCFFFSFLKEKGLTDLLYLILSFQLTEPLPHCRLQYYLREPDEIHSKYIFPNIFIGIFLYIKQLPVCLFHLAPLNCAGTIHSKGKAIAHAPFILWHGCLYHRSAIWRRIKKKSAGTSLASAVKYVTPYLSCTIKKTNLVILRKLRCAMMHLLLAREESENLTTSLAILLQRTNLQEQADSANTFL